MCECFGGWKWSDLDEECVLDCAKVNKSSGYAVSAEECLCAPGYLWANNQCIVDCTQVTYSTGNSTVTGACNCIDGYQWDLLLSSCSKISAVNCFNTSPSKDGT